eukprot:6413636-Amphidinium_carterae.1
MTLESSIPRTPRAAGLTRVSFSPELRMKVVSYMLATKHSNNKSKRQAFCMTQHFQNLCESSPLSRSVLNYFFGR